MSHLATDLGELTGVELYHLIKQLDRWEVLTETAARSGRFGASELQSLNRMYLDFVECKEIALTQLFRITVTMRQCEHLITHTSRASRHPMKVAGT